MFAHNSYSYLSSSGYSRFFPLSGKYFSYYETGCLYSASVRIVWKSAKCLTKRLTLHRMQVWICAMTSSPLAHWYSWYATPEPATWFIQCGLSWLICRDTAPPSCSAWSLTLGVFVANDFYECSLSSWDRRVRVQLTLTLFPFLFFLCYWLNSSSRCRPIFLPYASLLNWSNQMISDTNICGVNLCHSNQTLKLIITHGIHLDLFTNCFVNNVHIEKYKAMEPKVRIPPPLLIMHLVVYSVHIPKFITEVNQVHIMIAWVVRIQT